MSATEEVIRKLAYELSSMSRVDSARA